MTIVLKEAARRRITRRRKVESNGKPREYSHAPTKSGGANAANQTAIARRLTLMNEFVAASREYSQGAALSDEAVSREAIYAGRGA